MTLFEQMDWLFFAYYTGLYIALDEGESQPVNAVHDFGAEIM